MFIKALLLKVVKMSKIANMLNMIQILKDKKIHSKRIGRDYYIPKVSIINYLMY